MKKIILLITVLITTLNLHAEDESKGNDKELSKEQTPATKQPRIWNASVGVGAGLKKNLRVNNRYKDMGNKVLFKPIPFIEGNYGRLSLGIEGVSYRFLGNPLINARVYLNADGDRYYGPNMQPRRTSAFVGLSAQYTKFSISASHDISAHSKGNLVKLSYGEIFIINEKLIFRTGLSLEWADDRYAEYYYGVRPYEATSTNREYHLNNYLQPGISFLTIYRLAPKLSFITGVSFKLVPKDVRNSPTMNGDKMDVGGFFGLSYAL